MAGMAERLMWSADLRDFNLPSMVCLLKNQSYVLTCWLLLCDFLLFLVSTASTTSMVFDDAPVYRYSMCNGTEYNFFECQLPIPDSDSMCPSLATVDCTEGLHNYIVTIILCTDQLWLCLHDSLHNYPVYTCATRSKAIRLFACTVSTKTARSRDLGICATRKHKSVEIFEKTSLCLELFDKAHEWCKHCVCVDHAYLHVLMHTT